MKKLHATINKSFIIIWIKKIDEINVLRGQKYLYNATYNEQLYSNYIMNYYM